MNLYRSKFEHDNCGIGAVVSIKGVKSHQCVSDALKIVERLEHRAGKDGEGKTGDGVGIMLQISHSFFSKVAKEMKIEIGNEREYGVGMFFFPADEQLKNIAMKKFEEIVASENLEFISWRKAKINEDILSDKARNCMPNIYQAFIKKPQDIAIGLDFDRCLYVVRRLFEKTCKETYVVSLSSRTIVYKGMFLVTQLRNFYLDLTDEDYESAIGIVHSRFSTNTNPSWQRAHPNRLIVHNGEINTIKGNADRMRAREASMDSSFLRSNRDKIVPIVDTRGSDSAMLDNTLEFLLMNNISLPLAIMMCIPEPWDYNSGISQSKKDFYQYYATMMEPWDGPASILFSDGDLMGAVLDRNGLRPSRYYLTNDDDLILSSEVGVLPIEEERLKLKDRLRPGKMLLVDMVKGQLIEDDMVKKYYAKSKPYGEWLDQNLVKLRELKIPNKRVEKYSHEKRRKLQKAFGYNYEDLKNTILPMALNGSEQIGAMGIDSPLAVLSKRHQPLFNYFKQLFAQVTNPPIDSIREKIVTSTTLYLGRNGNLLEDSAENCQMLRINNPILTDTDLLKIKSMNKKGFKVVTLPITFSKEISLEKALDDLFLAADKAYSDGANILVLSDRDIDQDHLTIPSLLAVSALQQFLVNTRKRTNLSLILESGEPREVHHFATLLGYGASAINPYLAHESIYELIDENLLDKDYYAAVDAYNNAIITGIVKIASKMGVSTVQSYQGAKIFEAIGISQEVIDKYFEGTVSRIGGISIKDIEQDVRTIHDHVFDPNNLQVDAALDSNGLYKARSGKEEHQYNPQTIHLLQLATRNNDYETFKEYTACLNKEESINNLRGMLEIKTSNHPIDLSEVESVESIVKRFKTGAMSYGSISKEAHETMAIAMNTLHGKSNSGEGGEEKERLSIGKDGLNRCSAIKQVASGRFGVTSEYLVSANEIQIKMAQGAKPGEGGHLPGKKVYPWIAKTRLSTPGVSLISPPPHHDIYSIEDLAELIYDLKNANKDARISVKLVSEAGVGTIASGVAKAGAGVILISGYDGGTGAAPRSSIYNAGLPWELGLAETHQTLIKNKLRDKVVIETDGKLMCAKDVAIATMLGAEEFGFATAPLVSMGCVMMRVCNLDTCPVGIATQNPELRKNFKGKPEYVINFMKFIASELREIMASMGIKKLDELVGRSDLLSVKETSERLSKVDLSAIINHDGLQEMPEIKYDKKNNYDFKLETTIDEHILLDKFKQSLVTGEKAEVEIDISNINRSLGTLFGSHITKKFGNSLADDTFSVYCHGAGGQSFGAFIPKGLTLKLEGDSNDYFGKGLSGGKLIVYPSPKATYQADENIIIGNVALYGATSGKAFISGVSGERFAVRNSGAYVVAEGCGDHGCEYMTGGVAVILGKVGKNFAAGMSGGIAYVYDDDDTLYQRVNKDMVDLEKVKITKDQELIKSLIKEHALLTNSVKAKTILDDFDNYILKFKKIIPIDYQKMMDAIEKYQAEGMNEEAASSAAFHSLVK